jgi:hypothetical protein
MDVSNCKNFPPCKSLECKRYAEFILDGIELCGYCAVTLLVGRVNQLNVLLQSATAISEVPLVYPSALKE